MSVTFTSGPGNTIGYAVTCGCEDATVRAPRYGTYEDAVGALGTLESFVTAGYAARSSLPGCEMPGVCPDYVLWVRELTDVTPPEVNVSNTNAVGLLDALGYGPHGEMAGCATAEDFLGRVLTALAVAPADEGVPAHQQTAPSWMRGEHGTGPRWCEGGRRQGWLQDTLGALHELAQWCARHDRTMRWN